MPDSEEMILRAALVDALESLLEQLYAFRAVLEVHGPEDWEIPYVSVVTLLRDKRPERFQRFLDEFRETVLAFDEQTQPAPDWKKVVRNLILSVEELGPPDQIA